MSDRNPFVPEDPRDWKIFPRNLTAHAAYVVPGNPVSTRPEKGVDNSYPGLELDARNIQKVFFPGTYFEVYRNDGARLTTLTPADRAKTWVDGGLTPRDLETAAVYLWSLKGRTAAAQSPAAPPRIDLLGALDGQGLIAWRFARDLFPGRVGVVVGPSPAAAGATLDEANAALEALWTKTPEGEAIEVERNDDGALRWAVMIADRTRYLDEAGVLDPDLYQPGELTRTLCTPWTFDFRDCQCFYWASNKPDTVQSEDGRYAYLNFQRKNRAVEPQTEDIAYDYQARRAREIDYAEMMIDWEQLRPVANGREFGEMYVPAKPPRGRLLTLDRVRTELAHLAAVEHALAVQYLYAYYSIDAPHAAPASDDVEAFRVWSAAHEIYQIAIDEMRHFRWANEMLKLIGAPTTASRATKIGRRNEVPFYLSSLADEQLQWFVDIERPSRSTVAGLDGMYVGILESLQHVDETELGAVERRRAVELAKLIIDEGEGHYQRFSTAQQNLAFFSKAGRGSLPGYIRHGVWQAKSQETGVPISTLYGQPQVATAADLVALQERSDKLYAGLLTLLRITFAMDDEAVSGSALRKAISMMLRLNAVNFQLAEDGATPLFSLPDGWGSEPPIRSQDDARDVLAISKALLKDEPDAMPALVAASAGPHAATVSSVLEAFEAAIGKTSFS